MDIRCYGSRHKDVCKGNVPPSFSCISKQCPFCCALHLSVGYPALVAIQHVLQIMKSFLADLESVRLEFLVAKVTIQISPLTLMLTALRLQVGGIGTLLLLSTEEYTVPCTQGVWSWD